MSKPFLIPISEIVDETVNVKTFYFPAQGGSTSGGNYSFQSKPGQFVMLWLPRVDQKPFSVGYDDGKKFGLTIFNRGGMTNELFNCKVGDRVGITGPFGTAFSVLPNTHYIMVAGGYGAAPLAFLADCLTRRVIPDYDRGSSRQQILDSRLRGNDTIKIDFLMGARNEENLLFENRLAKLPGAKIHIATDDGSKGHKGYVTDMLLSLLTKEGLREVAGAPSDLNSGKPHPTLPLVGGGGSQNILVVTCGPELMEKKVLDICNANNVACEVSIERYMKCGFGICGQCCVDDTGAPMCTKGPVVDKDTANGIAEFGKYHRDKTGTTHNF